MAYNLYHTEEIHDETTSFVMRSVNPTLSSLQEVIMLHLKELAFYLVKLKNMGVDNELIKNDIIKVLLGIIINAEYNQEQFHDIIARLYDYIFQAKKIYTDLCQKRGLEPDILKTYYKHKKDYSLVDAIKRGEKYYFKKGMLCSEEQKNLFDIMLFLIKSVTIKIVELKNMGRQYPAAYEGIFSMLSIMNFFDKPIEEIKVEIKKFMPLYRAIIRLVHATQLEVFGNMTPVDVSFSTRPGKAILVSGTDLKELELVLKATEDKGIDIYTQGMDMLKAHLLEKLSSYKHLIGHFGTGIDNTLLDFATFPGPILMTKNSLQKIEYLYRGRLFTTDFIAPSGVVQIINNNFEPLIKSALESKGFSKGQEKPSIKIGYPVEEIMHKINNIIDKFEKNEIKHLYIVGTSNYGNGNAKYFEEFFKLVPKDCFIISLAYPISGENTLEINCFAETSLIYLILEELEKRVSLSKNLTVFLTKCDKNSIATLLTFQDFGVQDIYMSKCPPMLVTPSLMKSLQEIFSIHVISNPEDDLKSTLEQNL